MTSLGFSQEIVDDRAMGVSKTSEVKSSSRKRKNDLEKGRDKPEVLLVKELEYTVKPSTVKGKKKKPSKVKEKPLQENVISSSLKQEAADGKGLGSSLWNGIQAEEGAAPASCPRPVLVADFRRDPCVVLASLESLGKRNLGKSGFRVRISVLGKPWMSFGMPCAVRSRRRWFQLGKQV